MRLCKTDQSFKAFISIAPRPSFTQGERQQPLVPEKSQAFPHEIGSRRYTDAIVEGTCVLAQRKSGEPVQNPMAVIMTIEIVADIS